MYVYVYVMSVHLRSIDNEYLKDKKSMKFAWKMYV